MSCADKKISERRKTDFAPGPEDVVEMFDSLEVGIDKIEWVRN